MERALRPDQETALDLLRKAVAAGKRRIVMQAPTGWGKTMLAAAIADSALARNRRVIFTVPAITLVDQTVDAFHAEGITDVGVLQGIHPMTDTSRSVQIASIQTLQRRKIPPADVVIIDEAHKLFRFYSKWMRDPAWLDVPFVGLSATPWSKGLGKFYEELIVASTTKDLIAAGILSPFRVFAPSHPDLSQVRTVAGDYHEGDLSKAMDQPDLVADVVTTWLERGEDRPTFVFAVDRAHAKTLQRQFQAAGVATEYIDAYTPRQEREIIRMKFQHGLAKVVVNIGCLTTGVDWDVRCIALVRPTKSEILFVQMIGRGLRTAEGKADCLILDHSDTHLRLGFVDDIHHERLDDGQERISAKREKGEPLPHACPKCAFLKPPKVHICPSCGFAPEQRSEITPADGELIEITAPRPATFAERQAWYSGLLWIARVKGYRDGWAAHKYRERFGCWPEPQLLKQPAEPSAAICNWVRSRQIAYAKARQKVPVM